MVKWDRTVACLKARTAFDLTYIQAFASPRNMGVSEVGTGCVQPTTGPDSVLRHNIHFILPFRPTINDILHNSFPHGIINPLRLAQLLLQ